MNKQQLPMISRRRFIEASSFALAGTMIGATKTFASFKGLVDAMKREASTAPVKVIPLTHGFFTLENAGGNITVFANSDAALMVDAGIAEQSPRIIGALRKMTNAPVMELINTHWHFDHTGGNTALHGIGATLTAHENTLKHLSVPTKVTPWNYTFAPMPVAGRPTNLIKGNDTMDFHGHRISIHYVERAHTDGDLVLKFEDADVLSTGDIFWNGHYPFIDIEVGGSIGGMIKAASLALSLATAKTKIVPGHGPVASKRDLQEFQDMLQTIHHAVSELKKKGMSLTEIIAAKPSAKFDEKWGDFAASPAEFITLVYKSS